MNNCDHSFTTPHACNKCGMTPLEVCSELRTKLTTAEAQLAEARAERDIARATLAESRATTNALLDP